MRRFLTFAASAVLAFAMLSAPDMYAQTRSTGSGSSSTRSTGTSGSSRSTGTVSQSTNRSTGTTSGTSRSTGTVNQNTNRSTGSSSSSSSRSTGTSSSSSSSRSTGTGVSSGSTSRSSGTNAGTSRSTGSSSRGSVQSGNSGSTRSSSSSATGGTVRSTNVNRDGLSASDGANTGNNQMQNNEPFRDNGGNYRYNDDHRMDDRHDIHRIPPRQRDPMPWDRPGHFWGDHPHYYGYRIHSLPPQYRRISHWGIDYYFYEGIYYRPFGGAYVVCRPPFGTPIDVAIDRAILRSLRFAYYCDTYRTYNAVFDNYNVIARQNLIIAQNNARIIAQNNAYALNSSRALSAYELANRLGLVQSYAYANSEYFYMDGVFYTISASGAYSTIVPPAGALVTSLPDDYEVIVMNGIEYYMVDNTVYRTTLFDGQPYLEVLGQMYGSLYNQYNVYR